MRLLSCQLQNVRVHGDLSLAFAPGLTLIGGANESGKSTLVEALHRVLFLRAAATGAPVDALRSRDHLGIPTVQLGFEAKGEEWLVRKRFSGSSGQVRLKAARAGRSWDGPQAEEELARLLGVDEMLGSKQARSVLPNRWAHLWVFQGAAGTNPLQAGKASYDYDTLLDQLERSGGAVVQQSPHDQLVMQRLEAALAETYTAKAGQVSRQSELWQRQLERDGARQALDAALNRLQDYEQAAERLEQLSEQLDRLQTGELPALQTQERQQRQLGETLDRLDQRIDLAQRDLEPIRLRHEADQTLLRDGDALAVQIRADQQRVLDLEKAEQQALEQERALQAEVEVQRGSRDRLEAQRQRLEPRLQLLADLLEQARLNEDRQRLTASLEQQRQLQQQRQQLERDLAALAPLSRADVQRLRQLQQDWRDTCNRQEAMAAGVTLIRADQPVLLDGEALTAGEERLLSSVFELQVGQGVTLEIRPGGGQALGDLRQLGQQQQEALQNALAKRKVATLEEAERLQEQRSLLEQRLAALPPAPAPDGDQLAAQLESLDQRTPALQRRLQASLADRRDWEEERGEPLPQQADGLQRLQRQQSETVAQQSQALRRTDADLKAANAALERFRSDRRQREAELPARKAELQERQQRLKDMLRQHGSRDALAEQLEQRTRERTEAEQALQRLQTERNALGQGDWRQTLQRLQREIEQRRGQIAQLLAERGAAKQLCDSISADDPHAGLERCRVQLEAAEAAYQGLKRRCEAQRELKQLFDEAVADLSSRYSEPLADAMGRYLSPLVSDAAGVQLSYDQARGFHGLELRRGAQFYAYDQLSGGMREQLAAALRLAMADVLRQAHDGCLPLVFDDAFANSDPDRVDLVKRMLSAAVQSGLQVILLTCDPASYAGFADRSIDLTASPEGSS